jgi:hypothetical protein
MGKGDCFSSKLIGGALAQPTGGMECPNDDPDGVGKYMVGIHDGHPDCQDNLVAECAVGTQMVGVNADGTLKCNTPPPTPCVSTPVTVCTANDVLLPAAAINATYTATAGASRSQKYKCTNVSGVGTWKKSGSATGVCNCVAGVVSTTNAPCDAGYTGTQVTTITRSCPSGNTTTTVNTAACVCATTNETDTRDCPDGWDGSILIERNHLCPSGTWTPWTDVAGGNTCTCTNSTETQTLACPSPLTGTGIRQERTTTCEADGVSVGDWTTVSTDCACVPKTTQSTFSCPDGFTGAILKERTLSCPAGTWSAWTQVSSTCVPIPPVVCNWNTNTTGQGPFPFTSGQQLGDTCTCGSTDKCYSRVGTGAYMHFPSCTCE